MLLHSFWLLRIMALHSFSFSERRLLRSTICLPWSTSSLDSRSICKFQVLLYFTGFHRGSIACAYLRDGIILRISFKCADENAISNLVSLTPIRHANFNLSKKSLRSLRLWVSKSQRQFAAWTSVIFLPARELSIIFLIIVPALVPLEYSIIHLLFILR